MRRLIGPRVVLAQPTEYGTQLLISDQAVKRYSQCLNIAANSD